MRQASHVEGKRIAGWFGLGAKILISLAALVYLSTRIDREMLVGTLGGAEPRFILAAILALALQPLLMTIRWSELMRAMLTPVGFGRLLQIIYVAQFFNQVLPASIGADVIRIWLARRDGCPLSKLVTSVFLDRLVMFSTLLVLAISGFFILRRSIALSDATLFILLSLLLFAAAFVPLIAFKSNFATVLSRRVWRFAALPIQHLRLFLGRPTASASVSFFCLASHANLILTAYLLLLAFGAKASFVEVAALMPLVLIAATLPISLGGWGVRELAMVTALAQLGVPEAAALSASVMFGIVSIVVTLPGAAIFATLKRDTRFARAIPESVRELEATQRL